MTDIRTYAWIFLSVSEQPTLLQKIIAVADGINHAIPMQDELQKSFGWLQAQGLVKKEGKNYLLTESGAELTKSISYRSIMKVWDAITENFAQLPEVDFQLEDISVAEIKAAYNSYKKMIFGVK